MNPDHFAPGIDTPTTLAGPMGALEALLTTPTVEPSRPITAIICHPHPLHQGTMNNKVVHTLSRACHRQGMHTIRFNYRGVGKSEGSYGDYAGELADCQAVITWAKQMHPDHDIYLAGFSFGCYIATAACTEEQKSVGLITVAPAVTNKSYAEIENKINCPWTIIQGLHDEVIEAEAVLDWQGRLQKPTTLITMETGHFFHGELIPLRDHLEESIISHLGPRA